MKKVHNHKIVLLGDTSVGKSSICSRFTSDEFNEFNEPTIGAAFLSKTIIIDDENHRLEIWDTAGQERYKALAPMYYRGAAAAVVVYDITSEQSFTGAKKWIEELKEKGMDNLVIILVGNKCDLLEDHSTREADVSEYMNSNIHRLTYYKASCKTGKNIHTIFESAARLASEVVSDTNDNNKIPFKKCLHNKITNNNSCC